MRKVDAIVYDLEIVRAVPQPDEERFDDIEYCQGWGDKVGMGVSVCAALDMANGLVKIFLADNLHEFEEYVRDRVLIGFNSIAFDDKVLEAQGVNVTTDYDLKVEVLNAVGAKRRAGYGLEPLARANLTIGKRDPNHALTPVHWQRGKHGTVINDCIEDVWLTGRLVAKLPTLIDPVTKRELTLAPLPNKQPVLL